MDKFAEDVKDSPIEYVYINLDESETEEEHTVIDKVSDETVNEQTKAVHIVREVFTYLAICAAAAVTAYAINHFVIYNAHIPTSSMVPTINVGDKLLGFRLSYLFSKPERGDVVIFEHQCYEGEATQMLIKRVIGVPGDTVEIKGGVLYVNGEIVTEDYLAETMIGSYGPYVVPENSYLVMGDNRNVSDDARYWDNTFVTDEEIIAKAMLQYSPEFKLVN